MATVNEVMENEVPRRIIAPKTNADRAFRGVTAAAGLATFVVLFLIGLFLFLRALPTFRQNGLSFFTTTAWNPDGGYAGVIAPLFGTIEIAIIAMVIAVPISLLTALFLTEYVPASLRGPLMSVLDLLAAVPEPDLRHLGLLLPPAAPDRRRRLAHHAPRLHPLLRDPAGAAVLASSPFIAGVLVSLMLMPTATSVMREVFSQAPPGEKEAALALGASRWRMIRTVVLPVRPRRHHRRLDARPGPRDGRVDLGRARARDRLRPSPSHILQTGGNSIGALIADRFGESSQNLGLPALMGAGLVLFVITLWSTWAPRSSCAARARARGSRSDVGRLARRSSPPRSAAPRRPSRHAPARRGVHGLGSGRRRRLAGASSFALVWLIYYQLAPVSDAGLAGFAVCWYVAFLGLYWSSSRELDGRVIAGDRLMAALIGLARPSRSWCRSR